MKKAAIILLSCYLAFVICCKTIFCIEPIPIWFHVHSVYSDGRYTPIQLKEMAMNKGYKGIVFTDHTDCFVTRWAQLHGYKRKTSDYFVDLTHLHPAVNSYSDYYKEINNLINQDGVFVAIAGREVTVGNDPANTLCHINVVSFEENPYLYDSQYASSDLYEVLGSVLNKKDVIYIYNHPKDCKEWGSSANMFYGIELMNDFSPSFAFDKKAKENYQYHLGLYLDSLKKTEAAYFVVGGADFHADIQWKIGKITTYFFPDEFSQRGIFEALSDGRTIAARNLKLIDINSFPSYSNIINNNKIVLEGKVEIPQKHFLNNALNVYKNAALFKTISMKKEKSTKDGVVFSFHFEDVGEFGKKASYVLEIPYQMVTSPFYFISSSKPLENNDNTNKGDEKQRGSGGYYECEFSFVGSSCAILTEDKDLKKDEIFYYCGSKEDVLGPNGNKILSECRKGMVFKVALIFDTYSLIAYDEFSPGPSGEISIFLKK